MIVATIDEINKPLTIESFGVSAPTTIQWGDGKSDEYTGFSRPSHQYTAPGTYTIRFLQPGNVRQLIIHDSRAMFSPTVSEWRPFNADDGEAVRLHYTSIGITPLPRKWLSPKEAAKIKDVSLNSLLRLLRDERRRAAFFPSAVIRGEGRRREYLLHPDDVLLWKPRSRA